MLFKVAILSAVLAIASSQHHASSYSSINLGGHEQQQHYQHAPLLVKAPVATYHAPALVKAPVYHHEEYPDAHPAYSYKYGVEDSHTHDIKSQEESRDGDVVKGSYSLLQPDGVTRVVHYTADKNGFNAQVDYSGHAGHPQHVQKAVIAKAVVAPVYHQAPVYNYHH